MDGDRIRFRARPVMPFPAKIDCVAVIDGDTITGKAAHPVTDLGFSGVRERS